MQTAAKTVFDCRQARAEIALKAGGDLDDPIALSLLEAHLAGCVPCRRYLAGMESSLEVLQASAVESLSGERPPSLWPRVSRQLPRLNSRAVSARFNLWVPTAAMAAACAVMVLVTIVQIERVAPFAPIVTPHLRTVLRVEPPRDIFVDGHHNFGVHHGPGSTAPSVFGATPVSYPGNSGADRLDFSADADPPSRWMNLEW